MICPFPNFKPYYRFLYLLLIISMFIVLPAFTIVKFAVRFENILHFSTSSFELSSNSGAAFFPPISRIQSAPALQTARTGPAIQSTYLLSAITFKVPPRMPPGQCTRAWRYLVLVERKQDFFKKVICDGGTLIDVS